MESLLKLGIDWKAIIVYIVNFGVIVFVLARFVFKPLTTFLDARKKKAVDTLEEVEKLKADFAKKVDERKNAENTLLEEARVARDTIEKEKKQILAEAYAEKSKILEGARTEAESLRDEIIAKFEEEIISRVSDVIQTGFKNNLSPGNIKLIVQDTWKEVVLNKHK